MIGSIQFHRREYSDALDYFERARTLREEVLPEDHVDIALIDTNIGACFFCLQRESEAMINFKRAALVFRSALGPYHPRTLSVARNIEKAKNNSLKKFRSSLFISPLSFLQSPLPFDLLSSVDWFISLLPPPSLSFVDFLNQRLSSLCSSSTYAWGSDLKVLWENEKKGKKICKRKEKEKVIDSILVLHCTYFFSLP